jgi:peptidoglycan/LPS O-acetylase OafA/YrhL
MWSLAVEEQFYLIWPILVYLVPRRMFWVAPAVAIAIAPIVRLIASRAVATPWLAYEMLPSRMDTLAIGALLAGLRLYLPETFARIARAVPVILAAAGVAFAMLYHSLPSFRTQANSASFNVLGYTLLAIAAGCVVCYTVALSKGSFLYRILTAPAMLYLGSISYMMYLCHMLALTAARSFATSRLSAAILGLGGTVCFASVSWWLMERPLLHVKESALRYPSLRD